MMSNRLFSLAPPHTEDLAVFPPTRRLWFRQARAVLWWTSPPPRGLRRSHSDKLQLSSVSPRCARSSQFPFGSDACNRLQYLFNLIVTYQACSGIRQGVPGSSGGLDFSPRSAQAYVTKPRQGPARCAPARPTVRELGGWAVTQTMARPVCRTPPGIILLQLLLETRKQNWIRGAV